ncbi:MAG: hypothetical protein EOM26_06065 [Alphaproteobacteria bacterium]|nr:hypothetical protein [Alphaproteobacteria bacterium]
MDVKPERRDPRAIRLLRTTLMFSGLLFFAVGAGIVASPDVAEPIFGDNPMNATYFGAALMVVGVSDFLIVRFVFKESNRK